MLRNLFPASQPRVQATISAPLIPTKAPYQPLPAQLPKQCKQFWLVCPRLFAPFLSGPRPTHRYNIHCGAAAGHLSHTMLQYIYEHNIASLATDLDSGVNESFNKCLQVTEKEPFNREMYIKFCRLLQGIGKPPLSQQAHNSRHHYFPIQ